MSTETANQILEKPLDHFTLANQVYGDLELPIDLKVSLLRGIGDKLGIWQINSIASLEMPAEQKAKSIHQIIESRERGLRDPEINSG